MNGKRFAGIWLQLAGRVNQAWGELTDDPLRETAGRRDQVTGKTQQAGAIAQEAAARQLRDFQHDNRNWYF
ncbi:MAG: CsbD family protein [Sulfuritalea sp.]|jgi:uncharacterized protein YjbJ (UPF0337 family)|nr:CsbD family protein [Sulfuritalea sp.]